MLPGRPGLVDLGVGDEFFANDHHVVGGLDPQTDLVAIDLDDLDPDVRDRSESPRTACGSRRASVSSMKSGCPDLHDAGPRPPGPSIPWISRERVEHPTGLADRFFKTLSRRPRPLEPVGDHPVEPGLGAGSSGHRGARRSPVGTPPSASTSSSLDLEVGQPSAIEGAVVDASRRSSGRRILVLGLDRLG